MSNDANFYVTTALIHLNNCIESVEKAADRSVDSRYALDLLRNISSNLSTAKFYLNVVSDATKDI
jgi:hypothetical protein